MIDLEDSTYNDLKTWNYSVYPMISVAGSVSNMFKLYYVYAYTAYQAAF